MKKRVRWLKIPPVSRAALAKAISGFRRDEFTASSTAGFIIERSSKDFVEAKFVERFVRTERNEDPFGTVAESEKIEYSQTHFVLSTTNNLLEIHDSPRSLGPALNALSIHMPDISVSPVETDVVSWLSRISAEIDSPEITTALITDVGISSSVRAKIGLKGTSGVLLAAEKIMKGKKYSVSKIEVQGTLHGQSCRFQLFEEGRALVLKGPTEILEFLRESLSEAVSE